jgi:hypothetical protein
MPSKLAVQTSPVLSLRFALNRRSIGISHGLRFFTATFLEQPIDGNFQRVGDLFQRFDCRNSAPVFQPRNPATG